MLYFRSEADDCVEVENITYDNPVRDTIVNYTYERDEEKKEDCSCPVYEGLMQEGGSSLNSPVYESVEEAVSDYETAIEFKKSDLLENEIFDDETYNDIARQ